jgi:replicative DNA helicase
MFNDSLLEKDILTSAIIGFNISNTRMIIDNLTEDHFYLPAHKEIFEATKSCLKEQDSIAFEMLDRFLTSDSAKRVIQELMVHRSMNKVEPLIDKLKIITKGRKLAEASTNVLQRLVSTSDINITIDEIEAEMYSLFRESVGANKWINFNKQLMSEYLEEFQEKIKFNKEPGLPMGIPSVTRVTGGARAGELVTIAGRPSMGKSSYALTCIVNHLAIGKKPALFSLEMGKEQIQNKLMSMTSDHIQNQIKYYNLRNPFGQKQVLENMSKIIQNGLLTNSNFNLNTDSNITFSQIKSYARELKYQGLLDSLFIDQLGLLVQDRNKERVELTQYTSGLKKLSVELGIPIYQICQLSRDAVDRPTLANLKSSGSIEEDSDIVIFPWRPYAVDPNHPDPSEVEVIIAKARDSDTGKVAAHFSTNTTFFREKGKDGQLLDFNGNNLDGTEQEDIW